MADYAKKKNDELAALCKERGLPHTGKKADLVKRLEDHDIKGNAPAIDSAKPAAASTTSSATPAPAEDEIDWDDEPAAATTRITASQPAAAVSAAGGAGQFKNPQSVANQAVGEDVTQPVAAGENAEAAAEPAVEFDAKVEEKEKTPVDFSMGLAERTLDEEIAKRKRRAEKFGLDISQDETLRQLERAKRFGTTNLPGLLNQALPEREKKRGREGGQDGGVRKQSRGRNGAVKRDEGDKKSDGAAVGKGLGLSEKDREAAERRKARFAKTPGE